MSDASAMASDVPDSRRLSERASQALREQRAEAEAQISARGRSHELAVRKAEKAQVRRVWRAGIDAITEEDTRV